MIAIKGNALLYLDGVEVPCMGASAQVAVNDFSFLSFQLLPTAKAFKIPYRTKVHLFVYDSYINDYILLFEGELTTRGYSFGAASASVSFGARGLFHHLQQMMIAFSGIGLSNNNQKKISYFTEGSNPLTVSEDVSHLNNTLTNILGGDNTISAAILAMIADAYTNDFCYSIPFRSVVSAFYNGRAKLMHLIPGEGKGSSRYDIFDMGTLKTMFNLQSSKEISKGLMSQVTGKMSRWDLINKVKGVAFYDATMPLGTLQKSFIMKPQLFYSIPPLCNVLLPSMISNFSFSDSMVSEPTRIATSVNANPTSGDAVMVERFYPTELNDKLYDVAKKISENQDPFSYEYLENGSSSRALPETDKERKFGQMMSYASIDQNFIASLWAGLTSSNAQANEKDFYALIDRVLASEMYKQVASTKNGNYMGPFNPYLVPGFPALVIKGVHNPGDSSNIIAFTGYVTNVNHAISPGGQLSTSASFMMAKQINFNVNEMPEQKRPAMPWYNASEKNTFDDENIGAYYKRVLGCDSTYKYGSTLESAAVAIYNELVSRNEEDPSGASAKLFTDQLNFRYLATSAEMAEFYGGTKAAPEKPFWTESEESISRSTINSTIFNGESRNAVIAYVNELNNSSAFLGV